MELLDFFRILRRRWIVALATFAVVLLGVLAVTSVIGRSSTVTTTPGKATVKLAFVPVGATQDEVYKGGEYVQRQMPYWDQVVQSDAVLKPAIDASGVQTTSAEVKGKLTTWINSNTLWVSITDPDVDRARKLLDAIGSSANTVIPQSAAFEGKPLVKVIPIEPATAENPKAVVTSRAISRLNLPIGLVLGIAAGLLAALLAHALDRRVTGASEARRAAPSVPVLGTTRLPLKSSADSLVLDADRPASEDVRRLRAVVAAAEGNTTLVAAATEGNGETATSVNLAAALAEAGARVLLVDADLRHTGVSTALGLTDKPGLTDVITGRTPLAQALDRRGHLVVLPSGPRVEVPGELLASTAMADLLRQAASDYDYVVVDTAPLLPVADGLALASVVSHTILTVGSGERAHAISDAVRSLDNVKAPVLGIVLNRVGSAAARRGARYERDYGALPGAAERGAQEPRLPQGAERVEQRPRG